MANLIINNGYQWDNKLKLDQWDIDRNENIFLKINDLTSIEKIYFIKELVSETVFNNLWYDDKVVKQYIPGSIRHAIIRCNIYDIIPAWYDRSSSESLYVNWHTKWQYDLYDSSDIAYYEWIWRESQFFNICLEVDSGWIFEDKNLRPSKDDFKYSLKKDYIYKSITSWNQ